VFLIGMQLQSCPHHVVKHEIRKQKNSLTVKYFTVMSSYFSNLIGGIS